MQVSLMSSPVIREQILHIYLSNYMAEFCLYVQAFPTKAPQILTPRK